MRVQAYQDGSQTYQRRKSGYDSVLYGIEQARQHRHEKEQYQRVERCGAHVNAGPPQ